MIPQQRPETFTCRTCRQTLPISLRSSSGPKKHEWCRDCANTYKRQWRERTGRTGSALLARERDQARRVAVALEQELDLLRRALARRGVDVEWLLAADRAVRA